MFYAPWMMGLGVVAVELFSAPRTVMESSPNWIYPMAFVFTFLVGLGALLFSLPDTQIP